MPSYFTASSISSVTIGHRDSLLTGPDAPSTNVDRILEIKYDINELMSGMRLPFNVTDDDPDGEHNPQNQSEFSSDDKADMHSQFSGLKEKWASEIGKTVQETFLEQVVQQLVYLFDNPTDPDGNAILTTGSSSFAASVNRNKVTQWLQAPAAQGSQHQSFFDAVFTEAQVYQCMELAGRDMGRRKQFIYNNEISYELQLEPDDAFVVYITINDVSNGQEDNSQSWQVRVFQTDTTANPNGVSGA